jgi:hypothetical protein
MNTVKMPDRIAELAQDDKGRPVPFFVAWQDGKPDFRIVDPVKLYKCYYTHLCWICGQKLGTYLAFPIGPMCCVNRISAEPPSHLECAEYAAKVCPFLVQPKMVRREGGLPENIHAPPGVFFKENPGVTAIWVTKGFKPLLHHGNLLAMLGEPTQVLWYARGEKASREDVIEAFKAGVARFYERSGSDPEFDRNVGHFETKEFERDVERAKQYWPKA